MPVRELRLVSSDADVDADADRMEVVRWTPVVHGAHAYAYAYALVHVCRLLFGSRGGSEEAVANDTLLVR